MLEKIREISLEYRDKVTLIFEEILSSTERISVNSEDDPSIAKIKLRNDIFKNLKERNKHIESKRKSYLSKKSISRANSELLLSNQTPIK